MEIKIPYQADLIIQTLQKQGYEACVVGGCVRDAVMGRIPHDWDVATAARPEEMKAALSGFRLIETGLKHGTLTALVGGIAVEITTYRVDGAYSDNRHPDEVRFTGSLREDLMRRDFTMNALAYCDGRGLVDCCGGRNDIERKIIRCVGEPDTRFQEDGLRILRALRFAAELGFTLEKKTGQSVLNNARLLRGISKERIRSEWNRILCGAYAGEILQKYRAVFCEFIPEFAAMFDFDQHNRYHTLDVWEHTVKAVESVDPTPLLRLTMLLHDIGKPQCFTLSSDGVGHFRGHGEKSMETAQQIMHRLKYDKHMTEQALTLIQYHDVLITSDKKHLRRLLNFFGEENLRLLFKVKEADIRAQNPALFSRLSDLAEAEKALDEVIAERLCFSLKDLAISGNDLLALGIPQGERVGKILRQLLKEVMEEKIPNRRGALLDAARRIEKRIP
jgi:tRNA nucleotidyltransferase (CCA-adding enzyme)